MSSVEYTQREDRSFFTKVYDKTAAVIGCGGLGCNILPHLAGSGIGRLILCDFDKVSTGNLNRQFLYTVNDIGQQKVTAAAAFLHRYAPACDIQVNCRKISSRKDLSFADGCDILFLAVDNNQTRRIVTDYCREMNIPLVNGGINGCFGTAYLYVPGKSPCPACAGLLGKTEKKILSVSSTAGIIGSLEAQLGLKYLNGDELTPGVLYICDNEQITKLPVTAARSCDRCKKINEVIQYV